MLFHFVDEGVVYPLAAANLVGFAAVEEHAHRIPDLSLRFLGVGNGENPYCAARRIQPELGVVLIVFTKTLRTLDVEVFCLAALLYMGIDYLVAFFSLIAGMRLPLSLPVL